MIRLLYAVLASLPSVDASNFWQYLYEGDFIGLFHALMVSTFQSTTIVVAVLYMLFFVPLYIRTKSLMLICILWILLGGFIITAMPEVAAFAVLFSAFGVAGLVYRLFRPSSSY